MEFRPGKAISEAIGNGIQTRESHFRSDRKWNSDPGKPFWSYRKIAQGTQKLFPAYWMLAEVLLEVFPGFREAFIVA